jgi:hypothetical protein
VSLRTISTPTPRSTGSVTARSWLTDNRPETLRRQVHEALTDLRVEANELTYPRLGGDGQAAPSEVPLEDSLGALVELRDQGLIRRIGLSGANPGQLRRARAMTPIAAVQNRYNVLDRSGVEVLADCEAHGSRAAPPSVGYVWFRDCIPSLSDGDGGARICDWTARVGSGVRQRADRAVHRPDGLARRDGVWVGGQDAVELAAGDDGQLGEDLAQVVLGRARADEQPGADLRVRQAVAGSRATWVSWAVSSLLVSTVRLRAVSPVAASSRRARPANAPMPIASSMSCAVRSCSRASARRRSPAAWWPRSAQPPVPPGRARLRHSRPGRRGSWMGG